MSRKCGRRGGSLRRGNEMTGRRNPDSTRPDATHDYSERVLVYYQLPDGSVVRVDDSAAKGARTIDFTLQGGNIVTAVRVRVTPSGQ